jgi:hypothetical protein
VVFRCISRSVRTSTRPNPTAHGGIPGARLEFVQRWQVFDDNPRSGPGVAHRRAKFVARCEKCGGGVIKGGDQMAHVDDHVITTRRAS